MNYWFSLSIRTRLGVISVILATAAVVSFTLWTFFPNYHEPLTGIIKVGPILFLFWLSWSDLAKIPWYVYLMVPPIIIFCLIKPYSLFVVIPVAMFLLFVVPKN